MDFSAAEFIQRNAIIFHNDRVHVAIMKIFRKMGVVYEDNDGCIRNAADYSPEHAIVERAAMLADIADKARQEANTAAEAFTTFIREIQ